MKMESLANRKRFKKWLKSTEKNHSSKQKRALERDNVIQHKSVCQREIRMHTLNTSQIPLNLEDRPTD